jgi:hypothetical protein
VWNYTCFPSNFLNLKLSGDKPVRITVRSAQPNFEPDGPAAGTS